MRRFIVGSLFLSLACGGGGDGGGDTSGSDETAAVAPLGNASITGVVMFLGDAPANPTIDMDEEPDCAEKHTGAITDPVYVVNDGRLGNVFVRITGGLPGGPYPTPAATARINQNGCLYEPRVMGIMVGQDFDIVNGDPVLHNIKAVPTTNRGFNISQPREGMTTTRSFGSQEVMVPFECNVHGWMRAYVGVVEHPYFATSGSDGTFTISGLPAGTYTLEAWHETLGTRIAEVTVAADGSASVEFTYAE